MTKILKSRFPQPGKLILKINKEIKTFHDNLKLKNFMSNKPVLQKIFYRILNTEEEESHSQ